MPFLILAHLDAGSYVLYMPDTLEELYRAHASDLMSFAYSVTRSWDAAEDIVHDVFLKLWQRRDSIDIGRGLRGYLYTAVYNSALNHRKRDGRSVSDSDEAFTSMVSDDIHEDERIVADESAAEVRRALARLPERMRHVAILRWTHDLSRAEIAETLGTSEKTVANQLYRASELLREALGRSRE